MNVGAVAEISDRADSQMKKLVTTLRGYRLYKNRCTTETEVDFGVVAELILELELSIKDY